MKDERKYFIQRFSKSHKFSLGRTRYAAHTNPEIHTVEGYDEAIAERDRLNQEIEEQRRQWKSSSW